VRLLLLLLLLLWVLLLWLGYLGDLDLLLLLLMLLLPARCAPKFLFLLLKLLLLPVQQMLACLLQNSIRSHATNIAALPPHARGPPVLATDAVPDLDFAPLASTSAT